MIPPSIDHIIWHDNVFFYLFLIAILGMIAVSTLLMTRLRQINKENNKNIKERADSQERMRIEMLRREDERVHQWMISEKETIELLTNISHVLDLSDKLNKIDSDKILEKLQEIQTKVEKIRQKS